jgi:transcriptional regulator with XRE-family HTH domain
MTPAEVIAARLALKWTQDDLAKRAGISRSLVSRFEGGRATAESYARIVAAFEGVEIPAALPVEPGPIGELPREAIITAHQARAARQLLKKVPIAVCRDLALARATILKAEDPRKGPIAPLLSKRLRAYYETAGVLFTVGEVKLRPEGSLSDSAGRRCLEGQLTPASEGKYPSDDLHHDHSRAEQGGNEW